MTLANPPKALIALVALVATLSGCADRERVNCPRTKNQALTRTTFDTPTTTITIPNGDRCA